MRRSVPFLALMMMWPAAAQQQRDFLTADEVGQVRLAQEPNLRLNLYAGFAQLRIELLRQYFSEQKPGRSTFIHDTLDDYARIIETIDIVAEDALRRGLPIQEGITAVAAAETEMLDQLHEFQESHQPDVQRYAFSLQNAIDATRDSLELAEEDLGGRSEDVKQRYEAEQKKLEELIMPAEVEARREAEKGRRATEAKEKRKVPTLRRPGEATPPAKGP